MQSAIRERPVRTAIRINPQSADAQIRVFAHISAPRASIGAISAGSEAAHRGAPFGHVGFEIPEEIRSPPIRNPRKPCLFGPQKPSIWFVCHAEAWTLTHAPSLSLVFVCSAAGPGQATLHLRLVRTRAFPPVTPR